uniref:Thyroglobulin type-1 domain-containing protein n=1 Tax=Plectus sambesii TaxID=2011161 RepID=A0A914UXU5_9BILA
MVKYQLTPTISGDLRPVSQWATSPTGSSGFFLLEGPTAVPVAVEEEKTDCRSQRAKTMITHEQNPEGGVYVPTCTGTNDVLYDEIQCHKPTNYCWCVKPDSGEPIAGTSVQYTTPDCATPAKPVGEIK